MKLDVSAVFNDETTTWLSYESEVGLNIWETQIGNFINTNKSSKVGANSPHCVTKVWVARSNKTVQVGVGAIKVEGLRNHHRVIQTHCTKSIAAKVYVGKNLPDPIRPKWRISPRGRGSTWTKSASAQIKKGSFMGVRSLGGSSWSPQKRSSSPPM